MGADDRQEEGGVDDIIIPIDLVSYLMGMTLETLEDWHTENSKTFDAEVCAGALCVVMKTLVARFMSLTSDGETLQ